MRRKDKRKNKRKNNRNKLLFLTVVFISLFFYSIIVYGEGVFYAAKTFFHKGEALDISIKNEKNHNLDDINLCFINEGSCNVYLRGFIFVYCKNEDGNGTTLSNSSVQINYGDEDYWYISDDYIYYTEPLNIGNRTEKPMVESININLNDEDKRLLNGSELSIDIVMEAVQVNNFAYKYQWDIENKELEEIFKSNQNGINENLKSEEIIKVIFE